MKQQDQLSLELPLSGLLVADASRMLPGAVLARQLIDLGARLIKIEDPNGGDMMRNTPPVRDGIGTGFCSFFRGAESICLDLRSEHGRASLCKLSMHADILLESFRPGTMAAWGLGPEALLSRNPRLIFCSLSGFGQGAAGADKVGHDLNFTSLCGVLPLMTRQGIPLIQLADVTSGLLACSAILAGLLQRQKTSKGLMIDQPLSVGPMPFLTWAWAEQEGGGGGIIPTILGGRCPCYRTYRCQDGRDIALGAIEPKFWMTFVGLLGLPHLAGAGLDCAEEGEKAVQQVAMEVAKRDSRHWVELGLVHKLPLTVVNDLASAAQDPLVRGVCNLENTPMPGGGSSQNTGPYLPSLGRTPSRPAPKLGEQTDAVFAEFGL